MIVQSEARKKCLGREREREKRREGGGVKTGNRMWGSCTDQNKDKR
jgi:hypothetical protein